jgi:hypothetical protein
MPRFFAPLLILLTFVANPANAVIKGTGTSLGSYTVRIVGPFYCTGVAIARRIVVTAAHCANRGMRVLGSIGIAGVSRSALLDDGRHVSVSGDAAILKLISPLPFSVGLAPIGDGTGDTFTIAGYGTTDERSRAAFGSLHEASLVAAEARALVDPNRTGSIGASACFGDSGGPVMRGGMLVGIITRAAHPSPRIACGHLTRWAPITASGEAGAIAVAAEDTNVAEPHSRKARRQERGQERRSHEAETSTVGLFGTWFTPKAEARRSMRRKQARR